MSQEDVANELENEQRQEVRVQFPQRSWISVIQQKMQQNQISQSDLDDKHETHIGITPGRNERESLNKSKYGSSLFFREDLGRSRSSEFDPVSVKYKTQPHEVHFRIKVFLKYFGIRILFSIIGPFILLYGIFDKSWFNFMGNFLIIGWKKGVLFNYFRLICNYLILATFICYIRDFGMRVMHYEVAFFCIVYITENVTYAIKYAFFHPSKLALIEKYDMSLIGDSCEQSINPYMWGLQCPDIIDRELAMTMKRQQIEPTTYHMYFMIAPQTERQKRITVPISSKDPDKIKYEKVGGDGILIAKEIIMEFNEKCQVKFVIKIAMLTSILRVGIYLGVKNFCDETVSDYLIIMQICVMQFCYFFMILVLMMITYRDLRRKVFSLTQLSHLISAEKVEVYQEQKMFPTLNLLCSVSLFSWVNLRKMLLDYGLQYTRRQTFMISFIMIANTILMGVMCALFYLEIVSVNSLLQQTADFLIIAIISILLVLQGARINAHWCIHRGLLRKNLFLIQQLAYLIFKNLDYTINPTDPVMSAFVKLLDTVSSESVVSEDQLQNYSIFCVHSIQNVYEDLGHQGQYQPYTVMGIAMTYELLLQVCISVMGLIGTSGLNFALQVTNN